MTQRAEAEKHRPRPSSPATQVPVASAPEEEAGAAAAAAAAAAASPQSMDLPEDVLHISIKFLGVRQTLSQQLLCVCKEFRDAASAIFFNKSFMVALVPSLDPANLCTMTGSLREEIADGPGGDVAELLRSIESTDRGWEQLCRKVFLSEQPPG